MSGQHETHSVSATWDFAAARSLVQCAARQAPPDLAARLEEEWLADLMARRGAFARIRFGLGCCWATRVIAREFACATVPTGSSASGQRLLLAHGGFDFSRLSRRTIAMIAIACLHVAVFYVYLTDFARPAAAVAPGDIHIDMVNRSRRPEQAPRLPTPSLSATPKISLPKPNLSLDFVPDPDTIVVTHSSVPRVVPLAIAKPVHLVLGGPGAGFPTTENYYPAMARRLGEAGAAAVRVCVDPVGRLTAAPTILRSSGIAQLDQGALRLASAGSGHYRPSTENGRPITACYAFRIKFQLQAGDE
ncbi:MAG TPA: energy transducer TonB [Steroidobacteraceae bacterium]|nr:energy transducer TonB [Steroidobacteraceae bacterium]